MCIVVLKDTRRKHWLQQLARRKDTCPSDIQGVLQKKKTQLEADKLLPLITVI